MTVNSKLWLCILLDCFVCDIEVTSPIIFTAIFYIQVVWFSQIRIISSLNLTCFQLILLLSASKIKILPIVDKDSCQKSDR